MLSAAKHLALPLLFHTKTQSKILRFALQKLGA